LPVEASQHERIVHLINYVQNEVRYLGMESGIGAYKPHPPRQVHKQRYGDCKDKSLLLVALLRNEGLEADPMLVHTGLKHIVEDRLPGYSAFNHCIVSFIHDEERYYVDPTISNQGGGLENLCFPGYKRGLLLKAGESALTTIPDRGASALNIQEDIYVDSLGGNARFIVKSEYIGRKADNIRSYFRSESRESIQKEFTEYYSNLYPGIKAEGEIKIADEEQSSSNRILVEEHYKVEDFWQDSEDGNYIFFESYALVLESETSYPKSPERNMPYFTGEPFTFTQVNRIHMPESWAVDESDLSIEGDGFSYRGNTEYDDQIITVSHFYQRTKEYIEADSVASFIARHEKIQDELGMYVSYRNTEGFKASWLAIFMGILILSCAVIVAIRVYKRYNPEKSAVFDEIGIGSWLILPAIGFSISPFVLLYQIFTDSYFNWHTWDALINVGENELGLFLLGTFEFVFTLLHFVLIMLVLFVFYKRRTSAPRIISIYLAFAVVFGIADLVLIEAVAPGILPEEDQAGLMRDIGSSFISAALWIPIFNISERVKRTFTKTYYEHDPT